GPDAGDGAAPAAEPAAEKPAREKSGSDWFAPRKAPTPTSADTPMGASPGGPTPGVPTPGGANGAGASGAGTNGAGFFAAGPAGRADGPRPDRATPPGGPRADLPYFSDAPQRPDEPGAPGSDEFGSDGPGGPRSTPNLGIRPPGPSGPTTGPASGTSPLTPNLDGPGPFGRGPGGPGGANGPGGPGGPGGVPPRMSDDTAILTPQFPPAGSGPGDNVSGDTLNSGIPVVPSERRSGQPPFPGPDLTPRVPDNPMGTGPAGPGGFAAQAPEPAARTAPEPAAAKAPAKKGRSKLVLLGVAAVCLLGLAYGAGLLMNHSDVPKGTTVLGVDIGGGTKEDGVEKLEAALGSRSKSPLQLSVDGTKTQLAPDKAGLSLDSQATVRAAAGSDYNPVSVIGSLFGGKRDIEPVIPVDQEKLGVALTDLAGASGSASNGTIKFEPGKAVAVPGKAGKALDVNRSMGSVRDAYRAQVETGRAATVDLPVTTREPTINQAELDRAMKAFAQPAMSGLITIKAGPKQIQFGPAKSLPKILSMVPVDNGTKLSDHYDKKAIDTLCEGVFDGIMVTKGDGTKHQLNADDVAFAMRGALLGKTPAERTVTIDLDGNG
ncbi:hypothetical protein ACFWNU_36135, partial [Streptomyces sp. NPDC058427]